MSNPSLLLLLLLLPLVVCYNYRKKRVMQLLLRRIARKLGDLCCLRISGA